MSYDNFIPTVLLISSQNMENKFAMRWQITSTEGVTYTQ